MVKKKSQTTYFSLSEEAFVLSSLKEVAKVWAKGTGFAIFNLDIADGFANLQLGFSLGRPTDPNLHITSPLRTTINPGSATRKVLHGLQKTGQGLKSIVQGFSVKEQLFLAVLKDRLNQSGKMSFYLSLESFSHCGWHQDFLQLLQLHLLYPHQLLQPQLQLLQLQQHLLVQLHQEHFVPEKLRDVTTPKRYVDLHCVTKHLFPSSPSKPQSSPASTSASTPASTPLNLDYIRKEDELWTRIFNNVAFFSNYRIILRWMFCKIM